MTSDHLTGLIRSRPFRPFIIHTLDGRSIEVNHPDWIAYAGGRTAAVARPDETFEVIDSSLVPSLEVKPLIESEGSGN